MKNKTLFSFGIVYIIFLLGLYPSELYGQNKKGNTATVKEDTINYFQSSLHLIAKSFGDSVVLRWAPDKPGSWTWANLKGYYIERITMNADSTMDWKSKTRLNPAPIKAWPLDDWEKVVNPDHPNKYAAVAAQMLYGKGYSSYSLIDQANEYENRFSFALLAADISPVTADALGLRYVDKSIKKNEKYIYKVYVSMPSPTYEIDTAYLFINTSVIPQMPKVVFTHKIEHEKFISIAWDRNVYGQYYSAYYLERSSDGKKYHRIMEDPFINPITNDFEGNKDIIVFTDSLKENYKPNYYRVIGISPFGDLSEPSEPIKAMGRDKTPPSAPINIKTEHIGGTKVKISWEKPSKEPDLTGFLIGRSQNAGDGFEPLFTKPLGKKKTSYIDENVPEYGTNYYIVAAVDTAGNGSSSIVSYALMIDHSPPAPPKNINGKIDSTGVVTLTWPLGKEPDLAGYMVYFANAKDHTFTTLSKKPLLDTVFMDTIKIKTLTEEIFYTIKSVDLNYNYSFSSDTIRIQRPDIIPPTSPVFTKFMAGKEGIRLEWAPSSSRDAVKYLLVRKTGKEDFVKISEIKADPTAKTMDYLDKEVKPNTIYHYGLYTEDDAKLQSPMSKSLGVKMGDFEEVKKVTNLSIKMDKEKMQALLSWQYSDNGKFRYVLYRSVDGGGFQSYKSIEGTVNKFVDKSISKGKKYEYLLKVHLQNGKTSGFGNKVRVSF